MISKAVKVIAIKIMSELPNSPGHCTTFTFSRGVFSLGKSQNSAGVGDGPVIAVLVRLTENGAHGVG